MKTKKETKWERFKKSEGRRQPGAQIMIGLLLSGAAGFVYYLLNPDKLGILGALLITILGGFSIYLADLLISTIWRYFKQTRLAALIFWSVKWLFIFYVLYEVTYWFAS